MLLCWLAQCIHFCFKGTYYKCIEILIQTQTRILTCGLIEKQRGLDAGYWANTRLQFLLVEKKNPTTLQERLQKVEIPG